MSATEGVRPERRRLLSIILSTSVGTTILAVLYPILRYMAPPRLPVPRCESRAHDAALARLRSRMRRRNTPITSR